MHRSERPATGSYALAPVEIKPKGTVHVGEKSVCGVEVWRGVLGGPFGFRTFRLSVPH
jgi:hypothetical protein